MVSTHEEITSCDKILIPLDSTNWYPYSSHSTENEESMLDWEGQLQPTKFRKRYAYDQRSVSSVTTYIYYNAVESVILNSFKITSSDPSFVSMAESDTNDFACMLEAKSEHSEFGASILGMFAGNNEGCEVLCVSDEPTFMNGDKFDFASVSSA